MTKTTKFENATKFESKVDEETNELKKNIKRLKWQNLNTERNKLIINVKNDLTWLRSHVTSSMTMSAVVMKLLNWKYILSYGQKMTRQEEDKSWKSFETVITSYEKVMEKSSKRDVHVINKSRASLKQVMNKS